MEVKETSLKKKKNIHSEHHGFERRDTIYTCLIALAVLLLIIMAILMLVFVFISLGREERTFTNEEAMSDFLTVVTSLNIDSESGRALPTKETASSSAWRVVSDVREKAALPVNSYLQREASEAFEGKLVLDGVLLCTVRASVFVRTLSYPTDGVCDVIMFNSLFVPGGNTLIPPYSKFFLQFLDAASNNSKTEYGVGIDHYFCRNETFMSSLVAEQTTKTSLDEMWSHRVHHYGQVNSPPILTRFDTFEYVKQSAKGLQMLSQLMKDKVNSEHQPSYTMLHYPLMYETDAVDVARALAANSVDLFVAFGYTAYSDYGRKDCRMVPPILHSTQLLEPGLLNGAYPVRLVRVLSALATLKKVLKNTPALAVSLGMGGRWYEPAYLNRNVSLPGNVSLGHPCKTTSRGDAPPRHQISSIAEACEDPNYNETFSYDSTFNSLFAYAKSDFLLFTYDSADSFLNKICETKKNVTDLKYNIVADDIQFDDIDNLCGYGSYYRLRTLKSLCEYLAENYTSPDRESACKSVI
ncbi:hypothetical protein MRX96_009356 [Rhipicephalus microplus]